MAAWHASTVRSHVARDIPTGTPPSPRSSLDSSMSRLSSSESLRHDLGAVSVPHRPFFIDSHTAHRATGPASAASFSSSSNRALFTFAARAIMSARHSATARTSRRGRSSPAPIAARAHARSEPTPKLYIASSRVLSSWSRHCSSLCALSFEALSFDLLARLAPRVSRSSSSSSDPEPDPPPSQSSSSPLRRRFPTSPLAPSLYESYIPRRFLGPSTRKRPSRPACGSGFSAASLARLAASGSALSQNSSASRSFPSSALNVAVLNVFPARWPMARDSARAFRMWSMSSDSNLAASSPAWSLSAPCTPYLRSLLICAASSLAVLPEAVPPPSPPPSTASSSPYFFALVSNRLCSYVALVTSRYTFTSFVWPMRWHRAIAWRSFCGFQSLS